MRMNVEIDDELMADAMDALGYRTRRETIEEALRLALRIHAGRELIALRGQVTFTPEFLEERAREHGSR